MWMLMTLAHAGTAAEEAKRVVDACKAPIEATIDTASFAAGEVREATADSRCSDIFLGAANTCSTSDDNLKDMSRVTAIRCVFKQTSRIEMAIEGTVVTAQVGGRSSNVLSDATKWFENLPGADGLNAEDRMRIDGYIAQLEEQRSDVKEKCGIDLVVEADEVALREQGVKPGSGTFWCIDAVRAFSHVCQVDDGRRTALAPFETFSCVLDESATKVKAEFGSDSVTVRFPKRPANIYGDLYKAFEYK